MKISLMKIIDEYFGRIIVSFISLFKKTSDQKTGFKNENIKNILFIKFWGIGSIILTTPALKLIKEKYPDSRIYFLTLQSNYDICREINLINEILTIDISSPYKFISGSIKKTTELRKTNFDMIVDFEFYTYFSALIVSRIRSKFSIGFENLKNKRKIIFSKTILFNDRIHTANNFLNLVKEACDGKFDSSYNIVFPTLNGLTTKNGVTKIIVNPNASELAYERRLPAENFVSIIDHLSCKYKFKIILTGSYDEKEYVESIYKYVKNKMHVENLCGKTSVNELISLIQSSTCLITNDSGPLHIASALNIPVIAFFGPESPERYGPLSDKRLVFYKSLKCSPCMSISNSKTVNCIYDSPKCMEEFDMNNVIGKIDEFFVDSFSLKEKQLV